MSPQISAKPVIAQGTAAKPINFGESTSGRNSPNLTGERRSAGESRMAVTAIDHGGRVVTIISRLVGTTSSQNTPQRVAFTTSVHGGPLDASMWRARSWSASLRNHAAAVNRVVKAIVSDIEPTT